jgi:hypothetical protein
MKLRAILYEATRNVVCALSAYALLLQLILGAAAGAAHARAIETGVICTSDGAQRAPGIPSDPDHHGADANCCAWACATPMGATLAPAPTSVQARVPEHGNGLATTDATGTAIRGPPLRSTPQAPRAPPVLS